MKDRASSTRAERAPHRIAMRRPARSTVTLTIPSFVQDKKKLTMVAGGLAAVVIVLGVLVAMKKPSAPPPLEASTTAAAPVVRREGAGGGAAEAGRDAVAEAKPAEPKADPAEVGRGREARGARSWTRRCSPPRPRPRRSRRPRRRMPKAAAEGRPNAVKAEGAKALADSKADPTKLASANPDATKPGIIPATVFLNVAPWGEMFVNGKSQGVSPPMKSLKLDPGKYKIEIKNTTFPAHVENSS